MFQSPVVTLYFYPPPCRFKKTTKLFSRDCKGGKERSGESGGVVWEENILQEKFSRGDQYAHASISHPFSIKSLNPLSCYQCSLFPMSLLHARETIHSLFFFLSFFLLGRRREKNKPTLSSVPMLPFGLGQSTEACFESFLLEHAGRRARSVEIQDLPRTH